jgi:hypothetical protein
MKGVNYLTNDKGFKKAVVIDLKTYRSEIEDFSDVLEAKSRRNEAKQDADAVFEKILKKKIELNEHRKNNTKPHHRSLKSGV